MYRQRSVLDCIARNKTPSISQIPLVQVTYKRKMPPFPAFGFDRFLDHTSSSADGDADADGGGRNTKYSPTLQSSNVDVHLSNRSPYALDVKRPGSPPLNNHVKDGSVGVKSSSFGEAQKPTMSVYTPNNKAQEDEDGDDEFAEAEDWKSACSSSSSLGASASTSSTLRNNEFFDALEDINSEDAVSQSSDWNITKLQGELEAFKSKYMEEKKRRRRSEERLNWMKLNIQELLQNLSSCGLRVPNMDCYLATEEKRLDFAYDICRQIDVARFVATAIGRGSARAEVEQEMQAVLQARNSEIARLRDKIQYYEVVNHEMSQRNQETIEVARRQRRSQKHRQKWLWISLAATLSIGAMFLARACLPDKVESMSSDIQNDSCDD